MTQSAKDRAQAAAAALVTALGYTEALRHATVMTRTTDGANARRWSAILTAISA